MKHRLFFIVFILVLLVLMLESCITREGLFEVCTKPHIKVMAGSTQVENGKGVVSYGEANLFSDNTMVITIQNQGLVDLHITGISLEGAATTQYFLDTSTFNSVLTPGEQSDFTLVFHPTSLTTSSIFLVIYSDDEEENPYKISITGTGSGSNVAVPMLDVAYAREGGGQSLIAKGQLINMGSAQVGNQIHQDFKIINNGTTSLYVQDIYISDTSLMNDDDFQIIAPDIPIILQSGDCTLFSVVFRPGIPGNESISIGIESDDPDDSYFEFNIDGTGETVPVPDIAVYMGGNEFINDTGIYDFGYVQTGATSKLVTFTIKNVGSGTLTTSGYNLSGAFSTDFKVSNFSNEVLAPGESQSFDVSFTPSTSQYEDAVINLLNNDPEESPFRVHVCGTGVSNPVPDITVSEVAAKSTFDFGTVLIGYDKTESFTIENNGTADLTIFSISASKLDSFSLDTGNLEPFPFVLPYGSSVNFDLTFMPTNNKKKNTTITISSDDPDTNNYKFNVIGQGSKEDEPDINVRQGATSIADGATYDFGEVMLGDSSEEVVFTIENNGTSELDIESIFRTGKNVEDFILDISNINYLLKPGQSTSFSLTFVPTKDKKRSADIKINSNDPDGESTYKIKLIGKGKK